MTMFLSCSKSDDTPEPAPKPDPDDTATLVDGGVVKPEVGGPNQPNQVFVKLATNKQSHAKRDSWDFGFYCGEDFRVIINNTIKMAAKQLETTDITQSQEIDTEVGVGPSTRAVWGYVDSPYGELKSPKNTKGRQTAIAEISDKDEENKVYLVNMGNEVGTETPKTGSTALDGKHRGWKKVRITRTGNDYTIAYADLTESTFKTITVKKNPEYNFVFVSLNTGKEVEVQPKKADWDLSFTGITNYTATVQGGTLEDGITYYFADMVLSNIYSGTRVYRVNVPDAFRDEEYKKYTKDKAEKIDFKDQKLNNQLIIGSSWRSTFGGATLKGTIFYIIKDTQGNYFKMKFLAVTNDQGVRGYPVFEYELF